ncbi:SDR family oxidoreductase [Thermococcus argininiproducens]|uniref:SDR family oxidoreductase n=1 Tax=Thermococcus argininiproducens TaxID=2866384 RepID=A0A9E7M9Z8_9EURY|nr:SDR family oxidoreductase [Thermococcus argininiproducens]USG99644.1 SDR family oxidoreductase [Thermococcus argininiproducens]
MSTFGGFKMGYEKLKSMDLSRDEFSGKVALITGAGRGIGKELAKVLAWLGAKVIIAEISESGAEVEEEIHSKGGTAFYFQTDVSDKKSIRKLAERILKEFGKVDILVNNATIVKTGSILDTSHEDWDESWKVNVQAAVLLVKAFLPSMVKRKDGVIVMMTSEEGMPYVAPYSASKAALNSFGLSLATELGEDSGVSVFIFAPGMVDTPGIRNAAQELAPLYGMAYDEFINQSVNPGYNGLMPAEDCAAGLAYCIAYAKDYHGQMADPFGPLAKAGLLIFPTQAEGKHTNNILHRDEAVSEKTAFELVEELKKIMEDVERETNELNRFARMWVRRIFRQRTGMSIKEWLGAVEELISGLQELETAIRANNDTKAEQIRAKLPWMITYLEKLADNFKQNMKDVEGFIKDPEALAKALETLAYRENVTRSLIVMLREEMEA